nr:serine hydrolase [Pseudomonas insulae]
MAASTPTFADAKASDPITLGLMQGTPPPADKQVNFANYLQFPNTRWAFSHQRELVPTANIARGQGAVSELPRAERSDLDGVQFTPLGGTQPMTWGQSLAANYTDGIVVLHRGKVVYERYFGALGAQGQHMAMSVTKSFVGTLAAMLVDEGRLNPAAEVASYVPELKDSGFGHATVRQVMDMTTGIHYSENYADPKAEIWEYARAGHVLPRPAGYNGAKTLYEFLQKVQAEGAHGDAFAYKTVNTDVLSWIIQRVTGQSIMANLQERIWSKLGAEQDAYMAVDESGTGFAGGGLNLSLRDMARFGEMLRLDGRFNGQQIVPAAVVADIRNGGDKPAFAKAGYTTLPGGSYRNMWWVLHNADGAYSARGIHGQAIYIDPKAEMVIARFASHPLAANANLDPTSLPAYEAVAKQLMASDAR